jgi:glycosyltransferase involved in cell wall biosynthesis
MQKQWLVAAAMRPMKILQIVPSLASETGGPAVSVPEIARSFASLGHKVVIYTTTWPAYAKHSDSMIHLQRDKTVEIVTFPAQRSPFFPNLPHSPALVKSVLDNSREYDLAHVFSLWNPVATFSLRALRRSGSPYCLSPLGTLDPVVLRRNRWKKLPWRILWERANIEGAALIHFTAKLEEQRAKDYWHLNRSIVIPHSIDLKNWESLPSPSAMEAMFPQIRGREVILFVGRINWVKNLDLLLKALVNVRQERRTAMLLLVGPDNDDYQKVLEKTARELGVENHVLFTGMLTGDSLKSAYARANAFALVSQKENFGYSAAEALASGVPVVVSNEVGAAADWSECDAVFRVDCSIEPIASGLKRALQRSAAVGIPDPDARSLARLVFTNSEGMNFSSAFHSIRQGNACAA